MVRNFVDDLQMGSYFVGECKGRRAALALVFAVEGVAGLEGP